jgi:hypothetical protein
MAAFLVFAAAASVYVIYKLEILKLKNLRLRQRLGIAPAKGPPPAEEAVEEEVEEGVRRELETGTFEAVNPETGEMAAVDPDTGEMEAVGEDR